jgi:methanogenic corrinoid protein MtbC1
MKISKIAGLKKGELDKEVLKVFEVTNQPDNLLDSLIHAMIDFDEKRFEKTLSDAIVKLGFEDAFSKLIFPFLNRTGLLWATGAVRVAQEHFISNLIRRKLYVAIDGIYVDAAPGTKKFILFLPEGETHDMLLLFTEYLLRKHNYEVAYLGCSLPFNELDFIARAFKPDCMITYQTVSVEGYSFEEYMFKLAVAFPACKIIVGGQQVSSSTHLPSNCQAVHSSEELLEAIK